MYVNDHPPPHVHVKLGDGRECLVDIDTLALTGRITAREIRLELAWIEAHTEQLHDYWQRYSE
jgi:Domain of unknown function (DUF4160)